MISKRIERTLPLLLAAQQRNRALLENISVIFLCILLDPLSLISRGPLWVNGAMVGIPTSRDPYHGTFDLDE